MLKTNRPGPECGRARSAPYTEAAATAPGFARTPPGRMPGSEKSPCETDEGRWPIHELRGLAGPIAEDERLAAVGSDHECGRDGPEMQNGEKII